VDIKLFFKRAVQAVLPYGILKLYRHYKTQINSLPTTVRLEASTLCQLKCAVCPMPKNTFLGKGYLKFEDFKKFIDDNKYIRKIELSNKGEIFLNPDLIHIIKYAHENGIELTAGNGVNFNTVSDEVLEGLVKYQFRYISISIDGASQEIYSQYRINGNFDTVIENVKKLNGYKEKYNSKFPVVNWQLILMDHTENDIPKVKKMAKELNMTSSFIFTWDWAMKYTPKNREMVARETGLISLNTTEYSQNNNNKHYYSPICDQLFNSPQINFDGRLLGCCIHIDKDFGVNVFDVGFKKAVNSENYQYAKKMLKGKVVKPKETKNIPCASCPVYKSMLETGKYIP
jgi:MoaA/NifB/PqqE/SkfB family radical SAM enzyme